MKHARMELFLDAGIDFFVRRGWYEGTNFWSPYLKKEIEMAHQAGAKFGYIMTSGSMPLLDMFAEFFALIEKDGIHYKAGVLSASVIVSYMSQAAGEDLVPFFQQLRFNVQKLTRENILSILTGNP